MSLFRAEDIWEQLFRTNNNSIEFAQIPDPIKKHAVMFDSPDSSYVEGSNKTN